MGYNNKRIGRSDGMADVGDLKSSGFKHPCGFDSRLRHHDVKGLSQSVWGSPCGFLRSTWSVSFRMSRTRGWKDEGMSSADMPPAWFMCRLGGPESESWNRSPGSWRVSLRSRSTVRKARLVLAADIPRLLHDLSHEAATQSSAEISDTTQEKNEGALSPGEGIESQTNPV